jgi:hypothetical protein
MEVEQQQDDGGDGMQAIYGMCFVCGQWWAVML